jgi:hypothetical protein
MPTTAWEVVWRAIESVVGLLVAIGGWLMRDVLARVRDLERSNHGERLAALEAQYRSMIEWQARQERAVGEVDRKLGELMRVLLHPRGD